MKKILVIFSVLLSLNLFALNDGKYEVVQKNSDYTLNFKLIVKNSKILFVDFDKTDINGQRLSTINQEFRNKKENMKKYIIILYIKKIFMLMKNLKILIYTIWQQL